MIETILNVVFAGVGGIVLVVVLAGAYFMNRKARSAVQAMSAGSYGGTSTGMADGGSGGLEAWLTDSGYRFEGLPDSPLSAHVAEAPGAFAVLGTEGGELVLRRNHDGAHATWAQRYGGAMTGYTFSNAWNVFLASAPAVSIQIADKQFVSSRHGNIKRRWEPAFDGEVGFQDGEMAGRFRAYSTDPEAARAILERADIKAELLALAEVDLLVDGDIAMLNDPLQTNVLDVLGGQAAMMAMARSDPYSAYTRITPFHKRVHALLVTMSDAAGATVEPWQG